MSDKVYGLKNGDVVRQGDVILVKVANNKKYDKSKEFKRDADGSLTLAHGEVTGHRHRVLERQCQMFGEFGTSGRGGVFLKLGEQATLKHEEHDAITLNKGLWEVIRQREYSPFSKPLMVAD